MIDATKFKPGTVYVTYIAATPEKVWQALTDPAFTAQYFFGFRVHVEPKAGGVFELRYPDGHAHISGRVVAWDPPRHFSSTWLVVGAKEFGELPECLVTYDIEAAGASVRVTMTESHSWDIPDDILSGGRSGWPKIMSGLKSLIETGTPLSIEAAGPPPQFMEAVKRALDEKPWMRS